MTDWLAMDGTTWNAPQQQEAFLLVTDDGVTVAAGEDTGQLDLFATTEG